MTKEFEDGEVKQEARDALAAAFEGVGGMSKFIAWAKTHRSAFYSMYVKLLPMQVQTKVDVTHHDSDEALHKIQDAFHRLIASRKDDEAERARVAGIIIEDGETYQDALERVIAGRAPLEQVTYSRVDAPSTVNARPAPRVDSPPPPVDNSNSNSNPQHYGSPPCGGPSAEQKALAHPVSNVPRQPSSTELFYDYYNNGGAGRTWWGGIGEGGGPP
jgi:hypothetical protein